MNGPITILPTPPAEHPPRPNWLDTSEYPFESRFVTLPAGRMHWVDEGRGEPVVFVHGTPSWSFEWRHLIRGLKPHVRCVALDHLGFGLSDKPRDFSFHPRDHSAHLASLIQQLGLRDITLVMHDFGGPIGLGYAVRTPANVRRLVLMNTWCWPLNDDPHFALPGKIFGGWAGWWLYVVFNFATMLLLPRSMGNLRAMSRQIHRHYIRPFARMRDRYGLWRTAQHLLGAADWYAEIWNQRAAIANKPTQILWGLKDIAFREVELNRWLELFTNVRVQTWPNIGHSPAEELGADLTLPLLEFLRSEPRANAVR